MRPTYSRIPTTAQLRALEAAWIKACHHNWGLVLMETAGLNAAEVALSMIEEVGGPVAVFCGRGNNGGDGLVVARHLHRRNVPVFVYMLKASGKPASPDSEAAINKAIFDTLGMQIHYIDEHGIETGHEVLDECTLIIDALLGTGLDRPVTGAYAVAIDAINDSGLPVLSIDLPSGIHSDSGQIMGVAVQADATVTFGYLKAGLLHYPGAEHAGAITLIDIGLPRIEAPPPVLAGLDAALSHPEWWLTTYEFAEAVLPPRPMESHKGTFGRLLTVAGSSGMIGASILASRSALRTGVGLSVLATVRSNVRHLPPEEIIYTSLPETDEGTIALDAISALEKDLGKADAVILGPGLTQQPQTVKFVQQFVGVLDKPCIVDADGLNAIAEDSRIKIPHARNFVFTPHPMELSRLMGMSVAEIQADRVAAAQKAVERYGCNVVLKGAHTVVATTDGEVFINPTGNPGMATAGAGDVLSGIVGALLAEGVSPADAAVAATYIHGAAGDVAAATIGEDGMVAGDIMNAVPTVMMELRNGNWPGTAIEREVLHL